VRAKEGNLLPLMWSIFESKNRVAMAVGDFVYETNTHGTSKAFGTMFKVCGLPTDAQPQSHPTETAKTETPTTYATSDGRLDQQQCAVALEAVRPCETFKDCSSDAVHSHFTSMQKVFAAMTGDSPFTIDKLYAECEETCRQKAYKVTPVRQALCGY
jgi:hypothetical protein